MNTTIIVNCTGTLCTWNNETLSGVSASGMEAARGSIHSRADLHGNISDNVSVLPLYTEGAWEEYNAPGITDRWPFLFLILMMVFSLFGNLFVVIAVCVHDKLRTTFYYLLASLAVCDLLNTVFVMPFSLARLIIGELSTDWCIIWLSTDYVLTAAAFTHLWLAVCNVHAVLLKPLRYQLRAAKVYTSLNVVVAWIFAMLLSIAPIAVLTHFKSSVDNKCQTHGVVPILISSILPFYLPLIILIILHAWVSTILRRQTGMAKILANDNSMYSTSNGDVTYDNIELKYETVGNGQVSGRTNHKIITRMGSNDSCNSISDAEDDEPPVHFGAVAKGESTKDKRLSVDVKGESDTGGENSIGEADSLKNGFYSSEDEKIARERIAHSQDSLSSDLNSLSDLDLRYAIAKNLYKGALTNSMSNCSTETGLSYVETGRGSVMSTSFTNERMTVKTIVGELSGIDTDTAESDNQSITTQINMYEKRAEVSARLENGGKTGDLEQMIGDDKATEPSKVSGSKREFASESDDETSPKKIEDDKGEQQNLSPQGATIEPQNDESSATGNGDGKETNDPDQEMCQITGSGTGIKPKRLSKEILNGPCIEEEGSFSDKCIDTETLIGSLEKVKQKRESMEEDNAGFDNGDEDDMPFSNAIKVKRTSPEGTSTESGKSSSGESENGSVKRERKKKPKSSRGKQKTRKGSLTKEEKEKKNRLCLENEIGGADKTGDKMHLSYPPTRQPSRMSTVSYGSAPGPDGQRRSILRRDGSTRNSNIRKSVKFASEKNTEHPIPRETKKHGEAKRISTRRKTPRKRRRPTKPVNGSLKSASSNSSVGSESSKVNDQSNGISRQSSTSSSNGSVKSSSSQQKMRSLSRQNTIVDTTITYPSDVTPEFEEMDYMTRVHHTQGMRITLRIKRQRDILMNVFVIFIAQAVLFLPYIIVTTLLSLCPDCLISNTESHVQALKIITEWVKLSISAILPILFLILSSDFRSALKKFCFQKPISRTSTLDHVKF